MTLAEELASAREDSLKFLEWVKGWYRDILIYRVTESSRGISNLAVERDIKQQANLYTRERLLFLLSRALQAEADIRRNVNRRMALENFFAHVAGLR
jgi:DNA polymerase III gamma/tau subunit